MSGKTGRKFTPKQIHYLKRELITLELQKELTLLSENATLRPLFPVDNPANGLAAGLAIVPTSVMSLHSDTPLLRYAFNRFVLTFPLLQDVDRIEFWGKVQHFLDEFRKLGITSSAERSEMTRRKKIMQKIERLLVLLFGFGIKIQEDEESIRVAEEIEKAKSRDVIAKLTSLTGEDTIVKWMGMNGLEINVVTVRDIIEKKHMVEVPHAQFIIQTKVDNKEAVYVARRYGQFRALYQELKHIHPTIEIPQVPAKAQSIFNRMRPTEHHLYRERDRLSLRSFLHRVAAEPHLARSDAFIKFLTTDSFKLNHEESYNAERRAEMDNIRADQERAFREQVDRRVEELNVQLDGLKKELMKPGGLIKLFETIKTTADVSNLPTSLQKAMDWGQINFAFVLHTHFLTSDDAAQNFATLKRTHALVPYRTLRTILRLSNPIAMVRGVLDVFLAQPFGTSSLFQRIIMANLNEEAKTFQHDIADIEKSIGDPVFCQKIQAVVYAPQELVKIDTSLPAIDQVFVLLRIEGVGPTLTPDQIARIAPATQPGSVAGIHARVLVRKLRQLWVLQMRKRDQEMLMELVTQGIAGDLLKDIFAMFYKPLAQVYKAANIGDTLMDVSAFIDDLIQLVEGIDTEEMNNTVEPFIDLVRRHEPRFYTFVHSVHANDTTGIFDGLLTYIDSILGGMSRGLLTKRLDLDALVATHVPPVDQSILAAEIDAVCEYHLARKARRLERIRSRTAAAAAAEGRGFDIEMENVFKEMGGSNEEVNGVLDDVQELQFESDEGEDNEEDEWEVMEMQADDDGVEAVTNKFDSSKWWKGKDTKAETEVKPPVLVIIPKLVQPFVDMVVAGLATE